VHLSHAVRAAALALLLAAAPDPAGAQAALGRLTLEDAVALAARANPVLRAKRFEFQAVGANEITAGLRPNPTATYLAEQFGGGSAALVQHTFSIGQPIELGGKRQRRLESARAATRLSGHEFEDVRRQVVFQVKKAFTDALVARQELGLVEENVRSLDDLERIQRFRAERGDISELELLRIEVQRFALDRDAAAARVEYQRIGPDNTIGFGISVPIKIFDRNQGEIARTRAETQRVDAAREAMAVQILAEVDGALASLRTERQKLDLLRDVYLPKARRARDTVEFAYRRGGVSLLDYLDAQRTYRDTTTEFVRSLGSYWTAYYQLEAAVGGSLGEN